MNSLETSTAIAIGAAKGPVVAHARPNEHDAPDGASSTRDSGGKKRPRAFGDVLHATLDDADGVSGEDAQAPDSAPPSSVDARICSPCESAFLALPTAPAFIVTQQDSATIPTVLSCDGAAGHDGQVGHNWRDARDRGADELRSRLTGDVKTGPYVASAAAALHQPSTVVDGALASAGTYLTLPTTLEPIGAQSFGPNAVDLALAMGPDDGSAVAGAALNVQSATSLQRPTSEVGASNLAMANAVASRVLPQTMSENDVPTARRDGRDAPDALGSPGSPDRAGQVGATGQKPWVHASSLLQAMMRAEQSGGASELRDPSQFSKRSASPAPSSTADAVDGDRFFRDVSNRHDPSAALDSEQAPIDKFPTPPQSDVGSLSTDVGETTQGQGWLNEQAAGGALTDASRRLREKVQNASRSIADRRVLARGIDAQVDLGEAGRIQVRAGRPAAAEDVGRIHRVDVRLDADIGHTARTLAEHAHDLSKQLRSDLQASDALVTITGPTTHASVSSADASAAPAPRQGLPDPSQHAGSFDHGFSHSRNQGRGNTGDSDRDSRASRSEGGRGVGSVAGSSSSAAGVSRRARFVL